MEKQCEFCSREFHDFSGRSKYCSLTCQSHAFRANNPDYHRNWERAKKPILEKKCRNCGSEFKTTSSIRIFCSNGCKIEHHNAMRENTKTQIRECPICKTVFRPMQKTGVGRTYCTPDCRNKAMNQRRKSANSRKSWEKTKKKWKGNWWEALKRDNFTCQICGRRRMPSEQVRDKRYILEVHHKDGSGETKSKNHELDNLQTLCHSCHCEFHTKINLIQIDGEYFVKGDIFKILKIQQIRTM